MRIFRICTPAFAVAAVATIGISAPCLGIAIAESPRHLEHHSEAEPPITQSVRRGSISYQRYRLAFREICSLLANDGRREYFVARLNTATQRGESCRACRPLFRGMLEGCKEPVSAAAKKRKVASQDAPDEDVEPDEASAHAKQAGDAAHSADEDSNADTAQQPPLSYQRQREPSPALIQAVVELADILASDEKWVAETYIAIQKLGALLVPPGTTPKSEVMPIDAYTYGARDYFTILTEFVHQPFAAYAQEQVQQERSHSGQAAANNAEPNVDELFDL